LKFGSVMLSWRSISRGANTQFGRACCGARKILQD
jgi:hypothetical protein